MAGERTNKRRGRTQSLLPSSSTSYDRPNSISCWYCDFKLFAFNDFLFNLGWQNSRFLKKWFSLGVCFSLFAFVGVLMMLLWYSFGSFRLENGSFGFDSYLASSWSISMMDAGIMILSSLMSVAFHEFGHGIAAASEGLQIEYISIFLAILFPGALVALNYDLLQALPSFAALRIYCAGVWHNVVLCAVCALMLISLPLVLCPIYIHGEGPIVLEVQQTSSLSGFLSSYDVIVSVDGSKIRTSDDWMKMMVQINAQTFSKPHSLEAQNYRAISARKGYCVPYSWLERSMTLLEEGDQFSCPNKLAAFESMSCFNSSLLAGNRNRIKETGDKYCLTAKDVIKLKKCGTGWQMTETDGINCFCSEEESCMTPVQIPGISWVEISYTSPYSSECLQHRQNLSSTDPENPYLGSSSCGGTFVYVGDVLSVAHSIQLSSYRPQSTLIIFSAHIPFILEKTFVCTLLVSASLVYLNCLPVYFLDGESILEKCLGYVTWFTRRQQRKILQLCLLGGTVLSIIVFSKFLYSMLAIS
ncbi:membrane-bound transcription factor site-2 protease homolog isoform X1 [Typha latifolia]|uniref:membrane-bound transcription factor site-2 protease homolog isoform X1 n=2 Tax=Typha latifolia TaxID=4733 RepID=UPI003C2D8310